MVDNNGNSKSTYLSAESQVEKIAATKINPDFVIFREVAILGTEQDGTSIQYDDDGKSQYVVRKPGDDDKIYRGGVVEDWGYVERGDEAEPRLSHVLVDENGNFCSSVTFVKNHDDDLKLPILKDATAEEQKLLNSKVVPKNLALFDIAARRSADFRKERIEILKDKHNSLIKSRGGLTRIKAQNEEEIAVIKAKMADIKVQMAEKRAIVDEYDANKPWFMKAIDFVTENFGACLTMLGGGLGVINCNSPTLQALSLGALTIGALIATKTIDGDALMKQGKSLLVQASNAFGIDDGGDAPTSSHSSNPALDFSPS